MQTFLVTGANGDIGEAVGRILQESFPAARVIGADCAGAWPGKAVFARMERLPRADVPDYPFALAALIKDTAASLVVPTSEAELSRLAGEREAAAGLPLLTIRPELVLLFEDKLATADWLAAHDLPAPRTVPLEKARPTHLPLIVKPRRGAGARAIEVARTPERLAVIQAERDDEAVAQALLDAPDAEFTCAVVRLGSALRTLIMRRRLEGGVTKAFRVAAEPRIEAMLAELAVRMDLDGAINVQLRVVESGPVIFEINPRLSSTVMMRHRIGFRDLVWWVEAREGRTPPPFRPPAGWRVHRLSREVVEPC